MEKQIAWITLLMPLILILSPIVKAYNPSNSTGLTFWTAILFILIAFQPVIILLIKKVKKYDKSKICPICNRSIPIETKKCPFCNKSLDQ